MRRVLRCVVGVLLATGFVSLARLAMAQQPSSLGAQDEELRLPTILRGKPPDTQLVQPAYPAIKTPQANANGLPPSLPNAQNPPKPVPKGGRFAMSWDSETRAKPEVKSATVPSASPGSAVPSTDKTNKPNPSVSGTTSIRNPPPAAADALAPPTPPTKWGRPVPWKAETVTKPAMPTVKTIPLAPQAPADRPVIRSWSAAPSTPLPQQTTTPPKSTPAEARPPAQRQPTPATNETAPSTKGAYLILRPSEIVEKPTPKQAMPVVPAMPVARQAPAIQPAPLGSNPGLPATNANRMATPPTPTAGGVLRSARRWPPAYEMRPPESNKGRPGVIVFDDEPTPMAHPSPTAGLRPVVPADLQRQVQSVCGRQARDVLVETQHDGSVLVKVKVANRTAERQLPSKILTIPAMAAPNVRLETVIAP